jgi:hypothetical protein
MASKADKMSSHHGDPEKATPKHIDWTLTVKRPPVDLGAPASVAQTAGGDAEPGLVTSLHEGSGFRPGASHLDGTERRPAQILDRERDSVGDVVQDPELVPRLLLRLDRVDACGVLA